MKKRIFSPTKLVLLLISVGLFAGCGSREEAASSAAEAVSGVPLQTVRLQSTPDLYTAVGTVRSRTTSELGAQISGTVREVHVKEGDRVRRGQALAVLDDRTPRAQLGAAQAGVVEATQGLVEVEQALQAALAERQFAEATYRRYQGLLEKKSLSRQEFEGAETRFKTADANVRAIEAKKTRIEARGAQARSQQESAAALYSFSRIVSPIDGVVAARSVDEGTLVMPGAPLFTVEDTAQYQLEASLPEQFVSRASAGQQVSVTIGGEKLTGHVAEVVPTSDVMSRTFQVKIDLPRDCRCRSGQYGQAQFPVGEVKRLVVPRSALVAQGQLEGIFVINTEGRAELRLVRTGKEFVDRVEILAGLTEGERVATSQLERLRDGVRVEGQ